MIFQHFVLSCYNIRIPKRGRVQWMSIHEQVRAAMEAEEVSAYRISVETGLGQGLLSRFLRGQSPLSLRALTLVLDVLGYELMIRKKDK